MRSITSAVWALCAAVLLSFAACTAPEARGHRLGTESLHFSFDDYEVAADQIWRLTWSCPYKEFEITPAYDLRIMDAEALMAHEGVILHSLEPGDEVEVLATKQGTVWLGPTTRFCLANDQIRPRVDKYRFLPKG